jgi:Cu(I)/Ag(I) efflux system membrane protein CusA/SilA
MSLAGIAIAIGTMVDMSIVFMENIVEALDEDKPGESRAQAVKRAAAEVAPAVITSVATTVVSFLPVFALTASEGKLFSPLAFTKTYALGVSAILAVVVLPAAAHLILRARVRAVSTEGSPWRRILRSLFRPAHLSDWVLVAAGLALTFWLMSPAGLLVVLVGAIDLAAPMLPERWREVPSWLKSAVAVVAVTVLLARDWMPLGVTTGFWRNLLFVGGVIGLLMAGFTLFQAFYPFILRWVLRHKVAFLSLPILVVVLGVTAWLGFDRTFGWLPRSVRLSGPAVTLTHAFPGFGREFMPPFDEGSYLYMPTTMPHASFGEALEMLRRMDAAIAAIPEVEEVVGKLGRADSPLDPAPVSMFETVIVYRPEYRVEPDGTRVRQWRDHIRSPADIWDEIVAAAQMPGLTSAPMLQPIATRIVMLQSGMRAPLGLKIRGPDLETIEAVGMRIEELLKRVPAIRPETVFADRIVGKPYIEIEIDREAIARHGLTIQQVQEVIQVALGGRMLTRTVEGRERYPVRVRYMREERDSIEALGRILVPVPNTEEQHQIPLSELTTIRYVRGPQVIKSEDGFLTGYVIFDRRPDVAEVEVVEQARDYLHRMIDEGELELPAGVPFPTFSGMYENQVRSEQRLKVLIPLAMMVIFLLLYLQFRSPLTTLLIYQSVGVTISGGFLLIWLYDQPWFLDFSVMGTPMRELFQVGTVNMSVAVWVGFIALLGIATDDGVVMATYLKQRFDAESPCSTAEVRVLVLEAAQRRVRPALMTTATTILALLPVVSSQGRGSDVMMPMAIPALGGMTLELITLFIVGIGTIKITRQPTDIGHYTTCTHTCPHRPTLFGVRTAVGRGA